MDRPTEPPRFGYAHEATIPLLHARWIRAHPVDRIGRSYEGRIVLHSACLELELDSEAGVELAMDGPGLVRLADPVRRNLEMMETREAAFPAERPVGVAEGSLGHALHKAMRDLGAHDLANIADLRLEREIDKMDARVLRDCATDPAKHPGRIRVAWPCTPIENDGTGRARLIVADAVVTMLGAEAPLRARAEAVWSEDGIGWRGIALLHDD